MGVEGKGGHEELELGSAVVGAEGAAALGGLPLDAGGDLGREGPPPRAAGQAAGGVSTGTRGAEAVAGGGRVSGLDERDQGESLAGHHEDVRRVGLVGGRVEGHGGRRRPRGGGGAARGRRRPGRWLRRGSRLAAGRLWVDLGGGDAAGGLVGGGGAGCGGRLGPCVRCGRLRRRGPVQGRRLVHGDSGRRRQRQRQIRPRQRPLGHVVSRHLAPAISSSFLLHQTFELVNELVIGVWPRSKARSGVGLSSKAHCHHRRTSPYLCKKRMIPS